MVILDKVFKSGSDKDATEDANARRASEASQGRRDSRRGSWIRRGSQGIETRQGIGEGYTTPDGAMILEGDNTINHKYEKILKEKIRVGSISAAAEEERRASVASGTGGTVGTGEVRRESTGTGEGRRDLRQGSEGRRGSKGVETRQGIGEGYPTPTGALVTEGDNTIDHKFEKQLKEKIRVGSVSAEAAERRASEAAQGGTTSRGVEGASEGYVAPTAA